MLKPKLLLEVVPQVLADILILDRQVYSATLIGQAHFNVHVDLFKESAFQLHQNALAFHCFFNTIFELNSQVLFAQDFTFAHVEVKSGDFLLDFNMSSFWRTGHHVKLKVLAWDSARQVPLDMAVDVASKDDAL